MVSPEPLEGRLTRWVANSHDLSLVEAMLSLHKHLPEVNTPQEKDVIQRQITATDAQIDRLVYELYGLTEEEVREVKTIRRNNC